MTQTLELKTSQPAPKQSTCADCPYFESYEEESGRGTCHNFDQVVRSHNLRADVCDYWGEPIPFSVNDLEEIRVAAPEASAYLSLEHLSPHKEKAQWITLNSRLKVVKTSRKIKY